MSANVLIVGGGQGSWAIRGQQLGAAIGARVTSTPTEADWHWADLCVLVKRAIYEWADDAARHDVPTLWDALDFWRQPDENSLSTYDAILRARADRETHDLCGVIGATQAMAHDLGGVYLPHHSRPKLGPGPVRAQMQVVAYEGTPKYLGSWRTALEVACARLGLAFVVNPPDLRDADLVVAFRGEKWDGPICRRWKSGVKYVNAMAAGRPVLTQASAAALEIQPPGAIVEDVAALEAAIAAYRPVEVRQAAAEACRRQAGAYTIQAVARRYRTVIAQALQVAA